MKYFFLITWITVSCSLFTQEKYPIEKNISNIPLSFNNVYSSHQRFVSKAPSKPFSLVYLARVPWKKTTALSLIYQEVKSGYASRPYVIKNLLEYQTTLSETIDDPMRRPVSWSVAHDINEDVHVVYFEKQTYLHLRKINNKWEKKRLTLDAVPNNHRIHHETLLLGRDNQLHLIAHIEGEKSSLLHGVWKSEKDSQGKWQFQTLPSIGQVTFFPAYAFQVDSKGDIHVVQSQDRHLVYQKHNGKSWRKQIVEKRRNNNQDPAWSFYLELDEKDKPHILATFADRVSSWSLRKTELRLYTKKSSWKKQVLATKANGYVGRDGNRYTGASPLMKFENNKPHIIFSDLASWHISGMNDYLSGQVRYKFKKKSRWVDKTIFKQQGQSQTDSYLEGFLHPQLFLEDDTVIVFGIERKVLGISHLFQYNRRKDNQLIYITFPR